jgi:uncharacterized protein (DUF2141 family)
LFSCARIGSPSGGKKDTIAPKFLGANIDSSRIKGPRNLKELRLDFDEYVVLKDINKQLIISPPIKKIKKILPANLANKSVIIQWEDSLKANTTYNFNFGNAIADNHEGNVLPYFNYAFSTGDKIDDLYISGEVKNALSNSAKTAANKEKNLVVGLFQDKDSLDFREKPYYITKADDDGYYELNYLSPGNYRIVAFEDDNGNSMYDFGKEAVGFLKEKIELKENISGLNLKTYPSKKQLKYKEMSEISGGILMLFEGNPEQVEVSPLDKPKYYQITHRAKSDSVNIWFDAVQEEIGQKNSENLKFSYNIGDKKDTVSIFYKYNPKNEFALSNASSNMLPPNHNLKITANRPLVEIQPEKWTLESDSIKQNFNAKISETDNRQILVSADFKSGKKYQLSVPKETISSYYESVEKSYRFDFEIDDPKNYGSFTLKITNPPPSKFWIQLLDDKENVVYSVYTENSETKFTELKPATYSVRILADNNNNGYWDEADLAQEIFAEDAYLFPKKLVIKPLWEIVESWDLQN